MNPKYTHWMRIAVAVGLTLVPTIPQATAAGAADKKLRVLILSGQSNMVGHSASRLLANLLVSPRAEDAELAKMLVANYDEAAKTIKPAMEEVQQRIDALAAPVAKARQELNKVAGADTKEYDDLRKQVEALSVEKGALIDRLQYKTGDKVHIAAFGEIEGAKRQTGIVGPIATGCGANSGSIGPEYGFGMALEKLLDVPVLLIKVSWGGIDIDGGFRPPSSKQVGNETEPHTAPGPKYESLVKQVHDVLNDLPAYYPGYDAAAGHEMAGFFWFQGFNDQFGDKPTRYKEHMVNFIRDIRAEFKTPEMPFVIGVIGTSSADNQIDYAKISHEEAVAHGKAQTAAHAVAAAQREAAALPEFAGNVAAVESYPYYDYEIFPLYLVWQQRFPEWKNAGSDRAYHYLGSARFFARLGNASAEAMAQMMKKL